MQRDDRRYSCDARMRRRDAIQIGILSLWGLTSIDSLRAARATEGRRARAKGCILLWLDGGPSHLETFDLKPDAPAEVRGPFAPIATKVPGIQISELLANTAQVIDKVTIIRSMTSPLGEHGLANRYLLTGYEPSPLIQYPSYGSVVARFGNGTDLLPRYIAVPEAGWGGAGFLGTVAEPFAVKGDPAREGFRVPDLDFYPEVDSARLLRRQALMQRIDRGVGTAEEAEARGDPLFQQVLRMVTSPVAKQAFDMDQEPVSIRARYGSRTFGQSCLLARRLVERGVPFVTVHSTGWDTHSDLVLQLKEGYTGAKPGVGLIPTLDQGFSALVSDLADRGLLDETLVIAMGEFGRTPKINAQGGRDHWPRVFSVVLAGGGIRGGQVIGASDRTGESPADQPVTPADLAFSLYTLLGIDPHQELITPEGRPVPLNQGGQMIQGLI